MTETENMMNEAWIEQSLARLEALEAQQAQYEAAGQAAPPELAEEIQTLYEALDAAAEDEDAAPAAVAAAPAAVAAAPVADASPFAAPAAAAAPLGAPAPSAAPAAQAPVMMESSGYDDFDDSPPKSKAPLFLVAAVVVAGIGGGAWYMTMGPGAAKPAPPAAVGEPKVISASSVPKDTQEPQVAKGGDADRTPGTEFKEGEAPSRPAGNRPKNGGNNNRPKNTKKKKKKDDGRKIEIGGGRDPLAGID